MRLRFAIWFVVLLLIWFMGVNELALFCWRTNALGVHVRLCACGKEPFYGAPPPADAQELALLTRGETLWVHSRDDGEVAVLRSWTSTGEVSLQSNGVLLTMPEQIAVITPRNKLTLWTDKGNSFGEWSAQDKTLTVWRVTSVERQGDRVVLQFDEEGQRSWGQLMAYLEKED